MTSASEYSVMCVVSLWRASLKKIWISLYFSSGVYVYLCASTWHKRSTGTGTSYSNPCLIGRLDSSIYKHVNTCGSVLIFQVLWNFQLSLYPLSYYGQDIIFVSVSFMQWLYILYRVYWILMHSQAAWRLFGDANFIEGLKPLTCLILFPALYVLHFILLNVQFCTEIWRTM